MTQPPEEENKYPQKLGTKMVVLAWVVFLGLLTLLFGGFLDRQFNPNREVSSRKSSGDVEIVLEQNQRGHYVASALINHVGVDVMLDTGASSVSIPEHLAAGMQLQYGPEMMVATANGDIPVYATRLKEVRLGDIVLHDVRADINPYMEDDYVLLGMSFLRQLEFTQRGKQLILRQYQQH